MAELVMAMAVFGILSVLIGTTVVRTMQFTRQSAVRENTAQAGSAVMSQVSRDLRTAIRTQLTPEVSTARGIPAGVLVAFERATPNEVVFFSSVESTVLRERLHVDASGTLVRETQVPDTTSPPSVVPRFTGAPTTRRLARVSPSAEPLFSFGLRGATDPVSTVSGTDLERLTSVVVRLALDGDGPGDLRPVALRTTVRPYNL